MDPFRLFAATDDTIARLDSIDRASVQTSIILGGQHQSRQGHLVNGVMCCTLPMETSCSLL